MTDPNAWLDEGLDDAFPPTEPIALIDDEFFGGIFTTLIDGEGTFQLGHYKQGVFEFAPSTTGS
jgi:hypothetical protein